MLILKSISRLFFNIFLVIFIFEYPMGLLNLTGATTHFKKRHGDCAYIHFLHTYTFIYPHTHPNLTY